MASIVESSRDRNCGIIHHGGPLLTGDVQLRLMYYGVFPPETKQLVQNFILSINQEFGPPPALSSWWNIVETYQNFVLPSPKLTPPPKINLNISHIHEDNLYRSGRVLTSENIRYIVENATIGASENPNTIVVIFTDKQVTVHNMCAGLCIQHGSMDFSEKPQVYVMVGDPELECPEICGQHLAQGSHLRPPNRIMGVDVMLMNLAAGLANAITNPFNTGFWQPGGPHERFLGVATTCKGIFGTGANPPLFPGNLLIDPVTSGSYNVQTTNGMKFLLQAIWNPLTNTCWTPL